MSFDYDLFVIGTGSGGSATAKQAASYGKRVATCEQETIGGTCLNRGCIPKKFIVYAADFALNNQVASSYGWDNIGGTFDWSRLIKAIQKQIEQRNNSYKQQFQKASIELLKGKATLIDPHTIEIDDRTITSENIVIAVGGHPNKPDLPGIEHAITSREMFQLPQLPKRLAIVGGGYIGVEFSSMMNAFGVEVTLMDNDELILSGFDDDIRSGVQNGLCDRSIKFLPKTTVKEIKKTSQGLQLVLSSDSKITVDTILFATGRSPNTKDLGLEKAGVEISNKGAVVVDEYSRTTQKNIFAVGDCTSRIPLTPVARSEGKAVANTLFGEVTKLDYDYVPSAVFSRPEAATVGMSETKARDKFGDEVEIHRTEFEPLFESMTERNDQVMMKIVTDSKSRILGAHMVGENAADIIQSLAVAIKKGITKQELDSTIGIHPTTGEEFLTLEN
jgi:glutathione reductase (NADPH)